MSTTFHNTSVFTVDVEDWFHILDVPSTPPLSDWAGLESRVERNTHRMLDMFAAQQVKCTLFILSWVAERFPELVQRAANDGHDIASHGYAHELVYHIGEKQFTEDVRKAKGILEDVTGKEVLGYRAPGFSVTEATPWFFDRIAEVGYKYDSSVFPGSRGHGGIAEAPNEPYVVPTKHGDIVEFPISLASMFGKRLYFFGGGYLRFFPYALIDRMTKQVHAEQRPVIYYIHPREVDPEQPRLPMSAKRKFMTYHNLAGTEGKMKRIFQDQKMSTFAELMQRDMSGLPIIAPSTADPKKKSDLVPQ